MFSVAGGILIAVAVIAILRNPAALWGIIKLAIFTAIILVALLAMFAQAFAQIL